MTTDGTIPDDAPSRPAGPPASATMTGAGAAVIIVVWLAALAASALALYGYFVWADVNVGDHPVLTFFVILASLGATFHAAGEATQKLIT
jgi:hypothetical protein